LFGANGGLKHFDLAVASPPWNRSMPEAIYTSTAAAECDGGRRVVITNATTA